MSNSGNRGSSPSPPRRKESLSSGSAGVAVGGRNSISTAGGGGVGGSSSASHAVSIDFDEVKAAFDFLDASGKGVLKAKDLKLKLSAFYPNLTNKDYKFLIPEPDFTVDKLYALLENNDLGTFDPIKDAFRVYDPSDSGYLDENALRSVLERLGYGEITSEDMAVLIRTADVDGDGKVSLEDFRNMLKVNQEKERLVREREKEAAAKEQQQQQQQQQ
eukprot:ANDGO_00758.mRNA.1 Calmodulin